MKLIVDNWYELSAIREVSDSEAKLCEPAFLFPVSARSEIEAVIRKRAELKKAYDDSFALVLQLANKRSRGEFAPSVYDGMTEEQKRYAHNSQVRQMMDDGV